MKKAAVIGTGLAVGAILIVAAVHFGSRYLAKRELGVLGIPFTESAFMDQACGFNDNPAVVLKFVKAGMDPSVRVEDDLTALHCAAGAGYEGVVSVLLAAGADVKARIRTDLSTPLHFAAFRQSAGTARKLIAAGADVNARSESGTPLMGATRSGDIEMVRLLLDKGADPKLTDREGRGPLFLALEQSTPAEIVDVLIERGADVNARSKSGATALHAAHSRPDLMQKLIEKGADVNAMSSEGTPLLAAVRNRDSVLLLLKHGAGPSLHVEGRETPLIRAVMHGSEEVVTVLLDAGAKAPEAGPRVTPLLNIAAAGGRKDMVRLLTNRGADVNARGPFGVTAMHEAAIARADVREIVEILLQWGADINAREDAGGTPLMYARHASQELVELLVKKGADVNARSDNGQSVLRWFKLAKSRNIDYLISVGARD